MAGSHQIQQGVEVSKLLEAARGKTEQRGVSVEGCRGMDHKSVGNKCTFCFLVAQPVLLERLQLNLLLEMLGVALFLAALNMPPSSSRMFSLSFCTEHLQGALHPSWHLWQSSPALPFPSMLLTFYLCSKCEFRAFSFPCNFGASPRVFRVGEPSHSYEETSLLILDTQI